MQKATGREYVRLIKSTEYNDMIVKAREDSSKYCFNVELPVSFKSLYLNWRLLGGGLL